MSEALQETGRSSVKMHTNSKAEPQIEVKVYVQPDAGIHTPDDAFEKAKELFARRGEVGA